MALEPSAARLLRWSLADKPTIYPSPKEKQTTVTDKKQTTSTQTPIHTIQASDVLAEIIDKTTPKELFSSEVRKI